MEGKTGTLLGREGEAEGSVGIQNASLKGNKRHENNPSAFSLNKEKSLLMFTVTRCQIPQEPTIPLDLFHGAAKMSLVFMLTRNESYVSTYVLKLWVAVVLCEVRR